MQLALVAPIRTRSKSIFQRANQIPQRVATCVLQPKDVLDLRMVAMRRVAFPKTRGSVGSGKACASPRRTNAMMSLQASRRIIGGNVTRITNEIGLLSKRVSITASWILACMLYKVKAQGQ